MASGTIALTRTGSGYLTGQILWSSVSNGTQANTSTVTASLQIQRSAQNATTGTFSGNLTVGGTTESISWYGTLDSYTWVTVKTMTATVSHNADGAGSCYLYAKVNGPTGTTMAGTSVSGSATVTLDAIARYASIVSVTDFTDEGNPVITYSNPAGTAVSSLQACISLTGENSDVPYKDIPVTGTSYTFPLTEAERNTLRAATPNSNTLAVYVFLRSTIGDGTSSVYKPATMTIVDAAPTISPTVVDTNSFTSGLTGDSSVLVALHSTAQVTINAAAKKYATIVSQKVEHGSVTLTGDGVLSPVTNAPIKFTVTDSRGNTTTQYASNRIIAYFNPTCAIGNNMPESDGTFALVVAGMFYGGEFGQTLTVQYRYKAAGGSYGSWISLDTVSKSGNDYTATADLTGLDYRTVYTFQARAIDPVNPDGVLSAEKSVTAKPVFDWGQNDFQFNVPVVVASGSDMNKTGVMMWTDTEGGNIRVYPPSGKVTDYWDMDAHNGGFRIFAYKNATDPNGKGYTFPLTLNTDGSITVGNTAKTRSLLGVAPGTESTASLNCYYRTVDGVTEWINPPMYPNAEYRTTERYGNKPVYAKRIYLSALGAAYSNAGTSITTEAISVISIEGTARSGNGQYTFPLVRHDTTGVVTARLYVYYENGNYNLYVRSFDTSLTGYSADIVIKYTKD